MKRKGAAAANRVVPCVRRAIVAASLSIMTMGCDDDCTDEAPIPEGTHFEVTVREDSRGCYTTFSAGDSVSIAAGRSYEDDGCPVFPGNWTPEFTQTEFQFSQCSSFMNLGTKCEVTYPGCTDDGNYLELWLANLPDKKNQTVNTEFWMSLHGGCGGCGASIPVSVKWL